MNVGVSYNQQLPNEIFCNILSYLPHEEKLKSCAISKNFQGIIETKFEKEVAEARLSSFVECGNDDSSLFFLKGKRIYALSYDYFFKSATLSEKICHYLSLNNWALGHSFYRRLVEYCKQSEGKVLKYNTLPPVIKAIRIKVKKQEEVVQSERDKVVSQRISSFAPKVLELIFRRISDRITSLGYAKNEIMIAKPSEMGDDSFIDSKTFAALLILSVFAQKGIVVSDPNLTEASSLKGRFICLLHSVLDTALILPAMVLSAIAPVVGIAVMCFAVIREGFRASILREACMHIPLITVSIPCMQVISAITHLAGAIIHPAIVLDHGITPEARTTWIASLFDR